MPEIEWENITKECETFLSPQGEGCFKAFIFYDGQWLLQFGLGCLNVYNFSHVIANH